MPEMDYLTRMAKKDPRTVAAIINSVPISKATFNPEVVDRFTWIAGELPGEHVKTLLPKMLSENWPQLMAPFNRPGFEYQRLVVNLKTAKEYEGLIQLAQIMMANRSKEELAGLGFGASGKIFYLNDITETGLFQTVIDPENPHREKLLEAFLGIFAKVIVLGGDRGDSAYDESEPFFLPDVDLFEHVISLDRHSYTRDDIENLIAVCKELVGELFKGTCGNEAEIRRLYETYIAPLPDSYTAYRLRLFAVSACPESFTTEVQNLLLRIFDVGDRYYDIESGGEYHHTLLACFSTLPSRFQREYVQKVFGYFGENLDNSDKKKWRLSNGLEIMAYIKASLTPEEIEKSEQVFGPFPAEGTLKPHARSSGITSGYVSHKSPVDPSKFTVEEVIEHLKSDWSPTVLKKQYKGDDFFTPRGPEGLADELKKDFKARMDEYLLHLEDFFDRGKIDPSYVYSLLSEVDTMLRNRQVLTDDQCIVLIKFFDTIRKSGEIKEFEKSDEKSYLADWTTVHKMATDILLTLLGEMKDSELFKTHRSIIVPIVSYLLSIKSSPSPEHETPEYGDPAHIALNSVRGQAFRALVQISYNDGNKLQPDVKEIFEHVIDTDTSHAVRFTLGQFFTSFYSRDKEYVKSLMPKIFPKGEAGKENLYFATWEGYLSSVLYVDFFKEMEEYYAYAISLHADKYPDRKYVKSLDELLAGHMALAYTESDLKLDDPLFQAFWKTPNETRHYEFASFLGRHYLTRSEAEDWIEKRKINKQKLIDFWTWILAADFPVEAKTYSGFGFWINQDKEILEDKIVVEKMAASLTKSKGLVDWDYGLLQRIDRFAELNPDKTLEIITSLLVLNDGLNPHHRMYFDAADKIGEPLKIIYRQDHLKKPVEDLINLLIEKGSSTFWSLKEIIK